MRTYEELKQLLTQIKEADYSIPGNADADGIIEDMLKNIGHTCPVLRDDLIYPTLMTWCEDGHISIDKVRYILNTCIGEDYLFRGIGENGTDSVFTRTFSMLMIPVAFCVHDETPFLTDDEIANVKETVLRYIGMEKDFRSYIEGKGWSHSVSHTADALQNLAFVVGCNDTYEILDAVKSLALNGVVPYDTDEGERLAEAAIAAFYATVCEKEDISVIEFCDWLKSISDVKIIRGTAHGIYTRLNRKNFVKSLYTKLLLDRDDFEDYQKEYDEVCKYLLELLKELLA